MTIDSPLRRWPWRVESLTMEFDEDFDEDAVVSHIFIHIVFSTAGQRDVLPADGMADLYEFIRGALADLNCTAAAIGGTANHVHIITSLSLDRTPDDIIRKVKSKSAKWIRESFFYLKGFSWQKSYGGFGVGPDDIETGVTFIREQAEHHEVVSYQDEFLTLLREHDIEFDEKEVWE